MQPFSSCVVGATNACGSVTSATKGEPRAKSECAKRLAAMVEGYITARVVTQIHLPGPGNFLFGIEQHFFPLRNPARRARDREEDREHRRRESHRLIDEARVEVHVGIEATRDEVFILEGDAFAFERDIN